MWNCSLLDVKLKPNLSIRVYILTILCVKTHQEMNKDAGDVAAIPSVHHFEILSSGLATINCALLATRQV